MPVLISEQDYELLQAAKATQAAREADRRAHEALLAQRKERCESFVANAMKDEMCAGIVVYYGTRPKCIPFNAFSSWVWTTSPMKKLMCTTNPYASANEYVDWLILASSEDCIKYQRQGLRIPQTIIDSIEKREAQERELARQRQREELIAKRYQMAKKIYNLRMKLKEMDEEIEKLTDSK